MVGTGPAQGCVCTASCHCLVLREGDASLDIKSWILNDSSRHYAERFDLNVSLWKQVIRGKHLACKLKETGKTSVHRFVYLGLT